MRRSAPANYHTLEPFLELFKTGVPILMYHKIGPRPRRVRLRGLYLRREVFVRQLDELRQAGFTACPPAEANVLAHGNGAPDRFDFRQNIPQGGESRAIDLRGAGMRRIRRIEFWYQNQGLPRGKAAVQVFGMK